MTRTLLIEPPKAGLKLQLGTLADIGPTEIIFTPDHRRASPFNLVKFRVDLADALERIAFNFEEDVLVCLGSIVVIQITTALIMQKYGKMRIALFSASDERYLVREL